MFQTNQLTGDERTYFGFAENLTRGYYSPPGNLNLWVGPGYPITLIPFIILKAPYIYIILMNAFWYYFAVVLLYKTLIKYSPIKFAVLFGLFFAGYYIAYQEIIRIYAEPFTLFLISASTYFLAKTFNDSANYKNIVNSGFFLGYLCLTKIIFGYVLLAMLLLYCTALLYNRKSNRIQQSVLILILAIIINLPYLAYTYTLTGKIFYWGNSGGMSLYWMSTPFEGEFGDWNNSNFTANCSVDNNTPCNAEMLKSHHKKNYAEIYQYKGVERDEAFKSKAINNIKNHPVKYFKNCAANIGRMLFGFPTSYLYQRDKTLIRIPPNSILLTLMLMSFVLTTLNIRKIDYEVLFILSFIFIYLGASTLVSAYPRQFYIIVPMILFWINYLIARTCSLKLFFNK